MWGDLGVTPDPLWRDLTCTTNTMITDLLFPENILAAVGRELRRWCVPSCTDPRGLIKMLWYCRMHADSGSLPMYQVGVILTSLHDSCRRRMDMVGVFLESRNKRRRLNGECRPTTNKRQVATPAFFLKLGPPFPPRSGSVCNSAPVCRKSCISAWRNFSFSCSTNASLAFIF